MGVDIPGRQCVASPYLSLLMTLAIYKLSLTSKRKALVEQAEVWFDSEKYMANFKEGGTKEEFLTEILDNDVLKLGLKKQLSNDSSSNEIVKECCHLSCFATKNQYRDLQWRKRRSWAEKVQSTKAQWQLSEALESSDEPECYCVGHLRVWIIYVLRLMEVGKTN